MTREESIEVIKQDIPCEHDADLIEALEMAIQALSQECVGSTQKSVENALEMRCDDAISRELEIKKLKEQPAKVYIDKTDYQRGYIDGVNQMVKELKAEQEPCDDAINRRASIDALKKHFSDDDIMIDTECGAYWHHGHVIEVLQGMPPVTQKPDNKYRKEAKRWKNKWLRLKSQKSGKWIDINGIYAKCSNCNEEIYITGDFKFCPNCGADMRGDAE